MADVSLPVIDLTRLVSAFTSAIKLGDPQLDRFGNPALISSAERALSQIRISSI
jgi:hypothetical protein